MSVHAMYKMQLKNMGKSQFDINGRPAARRLFTKWFTDNGFDDYIKAHDADIQAAFCCYKKATYKKYKTGKHQVPVTQPQVLTVRDVARKIRS